MKTAIILGATGLTGGILLQKLLEDPNYSKVKLFSRSSVAVKDNKIEEYLIDLFKLEDQKQLFTGDEVYCCVGTTKAKTPNEETYRKVDYGIPVAAAKLAAENNIPVYTVISALGASSESKIFYNRIKGEMEKDILEQKLPNTYIFQPSLIAGDRVESRTGENIAKKVMKVLNPLMIGPLKKYRSIQPAIIAAAMIKVAGEGYTKTFIPSNEIKEIAGKED
ncbi:nucleoside-diphosphate sugar epimerase [Antarcticibacterium flavum]|uniref:Nucleoside-diphosphate sugar epimerase n=1 Tax=Antarcticibacterium flavum TaxID=2058175 RepID=A0A5B7X2I5_9FLAO|nr:MULTISPECIES: NAD(P)H-binding protein [Antarcticibacterium]MCM4160167.1 nucleoside-diphosphate sugar epimerase [Antarcticibacterium sp. W02-3]QCY69716.1 nucleoside-diphosphate sugar epimerase [Antarcticibacterium flavum]